MTSPVIVHEWIEATGGSETVVESFTELAPEADLVCLWNDAPERFPHSRIIESPLARTPLRRSKMLSMPFQPVVWRRVPGDYDTALVSSHLFAHHARFFASAPDLQKFVYVHTPARYIWEPELDSRGTGRGAALVRPLLRAIDRRGVRGDRQVAANSSFVAERIRRTWGEEATVIYPPVDVRTIMSTNWSSQLTAAEQAILDDLPTTFAFSVGRLVGYKMFDDVVEFAAAADIPTVIAGSGPLESQLRRHADEIGAPVRLVGRVSDPMMFELHRRALVFVFFGIEDFGMATVEAMAMGTPVIARDIGGSSEIVLDGITGVLGGPEADTASTALARALACDPETVRDRATEFSKEKFLQRVSEWTGLPGPVARHPTVLDATNQEQ